MLSIGECAFLQYMDINKAVSGVREALSFVFLQWVTKDGVDDNLNRVKSLKMSEVETGE